MMNEDAALIWFQLSKEVEECTSSSSGEASMTPTTPRSLSLIQRWDSTLTPAMGAILNDLTISTLQLRFYRLSFHSTNQGWVFVNKPRQFQLLRRGGFSGCNVNTNAGGSYSERVSLSTPDEVDQARFLGLLGKIDDVIWNIMEYHGREVFGRSIKFVALY